MWLIYPNFIQIHFGAPWPLSFAALLRAKVSDPTLHRKIALEGHRFTPREALEAGFVDHIVQGNTAAVLAKAGEIAESVSPLAREGVWGIIKARLEVCITTIVPVLTCHIRSLICIVRRWI